MQRSGRNYGSSEIENQDSAYEPIYVIPRLPGAFPEEVPAFTDELPSEIHELPGTTGNNNPEYDDGLFRLGTPFDWQYPEDMEELPVYSSRQEEIQHGHQNHVTHDNGLNIKGLNCPSSMPSSRSFSNLEVMKAPKTNVKGPSKNKSNSSSKASPTIFSNNIVIAVFGLTGTGKSSFISTLTGQDVKIGHGLHSCKSS